MADLSELTTLSLLLIFLPLLIFIFCWFSLGSADPHSKPSTPCPRSYPFIGNIISLLNNVHRLYDWATDLFSESSSLTIKGNSFLGFSYTIINTINPSNLEYILKSNFHNYVKGARFSDNLYDLLGRGIFNVDAQLWSLQRKIAAHEFNTKSLKSFISRTVQSEISNRLIPYLSYYADANEAVDLQSTFQDLSFDNICNLAFGVDPGCLDDLNSLSSKNSSAAAAHSSNKMSFVSAFDEASEICAFRALQPFPLIWKVKRFLNIGSERRLKDAIKVIDDYAMDVIRSKEDRLHRAAVAADSDDDDKQDLLSRFMCSNIQLGFNSLEEKRKFYRDIITNFILAGRDTTSAALTWFFWLISGHPRCLRLIYVEISSAMSTKKTADDDQVTERLISYDDIKNLNYLHAALSESMRLFPPVPINMKLAIKDDKLPDGTEVTAGWSVDYSAYAMGRMTEIWGNDCREFKPERWLDDYGVFKPCSQFKFPVFHCGPRICLGKDMAYVQMKTVAAAVIYNFEVFPVDGGATMEKMMNPPYVVSIVMKMKDGLPVKLKRRQH